ncbi:MAG: BON domain-containing protein [Acidobacteria bacterium]|nr:BON domain-containing protein [Acidobacteriota bacterium]MBU4405863.1 BON domain-containing protein [Acidobacteriota bacterium]MCG2811335.1 BON domain-containing protein [Candidatus Aminicenantes bacterium]
MKKLTFLAFLLLAFGASMLPAQEQATQPAAQLGNDIRNAILLAPHYGVFNNLAFKLDGNDVTLLGQVLLPITKEEISRRVARLAGTGKVTDNIEVLPLSNSDDALRLQVYRRLFGTSDLYRYALSPNPSIHIMVKGGRVTLEGVVSNEGDSRIAYMGARKVNGVLSVTNNLKILSTK